MSDRLQKDSMRLWKTLGMALCSNYPDILPTKRTAMVTSTVLMCFITTFWLFSILSSFLAVKHEPNILQGLFQNTSLVDINNGSMYAMFELIKKQPITMVMFYAPWSGDCIKAVHGFSEANRKLGNKMISFVAINCYTGVCKQRFSTQYFPRVFIYYRLYHPIEYLQDIKAAEIKRFILAVLHPWVNIGNQHQLDDHMRHHDNLVLGYMDRTFVFPHNGKRMHVFLAASIYLANKVNAPKVGLIVDKTLAASVGLSFHGQLCLYLHRNYTMCFPRSNEFIDPYEIVTWIAQKSNKLVKELTLTASDVNFYTGQLRRGPVAILAYSNPNHKSLNEFYKVALAYHECSCPMIFVPPPPVVVSYCPQFYRLSLCISTSRDNSVCNYCQHCVGVCLCKTQRFALVDFPAVTNSCVSVLPRLFYFQDVLSYCCQSPQLLKTYVSHVAEESVSNEGNTEKQTSEAFLLRQMCSIRLAASQKMFSKSYTSSQNNRKSKTVSKSKCGFAAPCCHGLHTNFSDAVFSGLACRTNRSLSFYTIDYDRHAFMLNNLGVVATHNLLVVDMVTEEHYSLASSTFYNMATSLLNFTFGKLVQEPIQNKDQESNKNRPIITELLSGTFERIVMDETQDVFVMFYTTWCNVCKSVGLNYLHAAHRLKSKSVLFARIDADKNSLPWRYVPSHYPSFILFPRFRKDNSIPFDTRSDFSVDNFVKFLEQYLN